MIRVNKKIMIHAYKRNGWLYRGWEFPKIIDVNENFICVYLYNARVITSAITRNHFSQSKKNSFWFFFPKKWFNIIATLNANNTVSYKINIASPFFYEEEAIKYYDFDLDIEIKNSNIATFKVIDIKDYEENKKLYKYEKEIQYQCKKVIEFFENEKIKNKLMKKISPKFLISYLERMLWPVKKIQISAIYLLLKFITKT